MISRPCQRCHRVRPIVNYPYCAGCSAALRAQEQRRPSTPAPAPETETLPAFVLPEIADEAQSE
jgi:hypothetical protein